MSTVEEELLYHKVSRTLSVHPVLAEIGVDRHPGLPFSQTNASCSIFFCALTAIHSTPSSILIPFPFPSFPPAQMRAGLTLTLGVVTSLVTASTLPTQTRETNAQRFARGLPPSPPERLFDSTRALSASAPLPVSTDPKCSPITIPVSLP